MNQTNQNMNNQDRNQDFDVGHLVDDKRLRHLLNTVIREVKDYALDQIEHIKKLTDIGIALSVEKDIIHLLEMIVDEARSLSNADAGTLYILNKEKTHLSFEILQNDTMGTRLGGTSGKPISLPEVPLYIEQKENYSNVSSYVALTGKRINIKDVYETDRFNLTGTRKYDASTGYRSKSMLVIPLKNHENKIIGVLQLLNAMDEETGKVVAFSSEYEDLIVSLASQAAIALTNVQLLQELKDLFYSFIKSIATAIDEKSPYTGGHINRVVALTMMIADEINKCQHEPFKDVQFDEHELDELRIAAWMHDVGKVTTPEYVVDKSTKLETIMDRIYFVETRFQLIEKMFENQALQQKISVLQQGHDQQNKIRQIEAELVLKIAALREEFSFIKSCNRTGEFMSDDKIDRIKEISRKTYPSTTGPQPYLTENEVENLCIRKGTLLQTEREIIENHARMTLKITEQLPFPEKLSRVPEFASGHHEKLDGSGYPKGLSAADLPWQSRIMAIADVFEALTAKDRPYKEPMKLSQALKILGFMKKDQHIDPDIYDLFIGQKLYLAYAQKELNDEQIDL
ncbi:HD domain-containing phosphohydrolase [candidate division CSSED10-310 bacterium]|uniref:HD domain-containing phosphohydrolase n=1 Tax=candidate division CSSED10-310 bacterium TaxID=2855610 RepID=A0ABV6YZ76_UNCC1